MSPSGTGPPPSGSTDRERRFQEAMQGFLESYRRGESPSVGDYAKAHPELSGEIQDLLPTLAVLEGVLKQRSGSGGGAATAASSSGATVEISQGPALSRLAGYRILREIGRGGMGVVYEAEEEALGRRVALKIFPLCLLLDARNIERFRREARAAARLQHPHIVPVFGFGEEHGIHYYAMQFIRGAALSAIYEEVKRISSTGAREGSTDAPPPRDPLTSSVVLKLLGEGAEVQPFPADRRLYHRQVASLGRQAAEALAHAHGEGVLHRDIKPSNLLVDVGGWLWVADFGLAKLSELDEITRSGEVVGTLRYMAPERFRGICDHRSDVYALGITLYELLTLAPAFDDEDRASLLRKVVDERPRAPREIDSGIPLELERVVLRAIEKDPDGRYPSARAFQEDLDRFLAGEPVRPVRPKARLPGPARNRRRAALALAAILSAIVLAALGGKLLWDRHAPRPPLVIPVGMRPTAVATGDFDRDGRLDIVVPHDSSNDVWLLRNEGNGSFVQAARLLGGNGPNSVAPADLDGDGNLDIAVANMFSMDIWVFLGDGRNDFRSPSVTPLGGSAFFVVAADLDGDGDVDLTVAGSGAGADDKAYIWILKNDGRASFPDISKLEALKFPQTVAPSDIDGDGDLDLVTSNNLTPSPGNLSIFWNLGAAVFEKGPNMEVGGPTFGLAAADLDGDGFPDLAGTYAGASILTKSVWILRNEGKGAFARRKDNPLGSNVEWITAGDLDRDGRMDLVAVGDAENVWLLRGRGDSTFFEPVGLLAGKNPFCASLVDLDSDGSLDLAVQDRGSGDVRIFWEVGRALGGQAEAKP